MAVLHPAAARAHLELGEALLLAAPARDRDEALRAAFDRARELDPADARSHLRLAELLSREGAVDDALRHARLAAALHPGISPNTSAAVLTDRPGMLLNVRPCIGLHLDSVRRSWRRIRSASPDSSTPASHGPLST